jgi:hypothetical protein
MKLMGKGWRAVALAALAAACTGDGGTETPVATTLTATSPATQTAVAGTPVATAPSVRVLDQDGAAMQGVTVTFTASSGGSVASPTATTDAAGNATAGSWTLGAALGTQTVTATVASLTPVQFSATATDPCDNNVTYTLGSTASASLATADCRLNTGEYIYSVNLPTAQAVAFNMSSTTFDTWLEMYDAGGNIVAINDDAGAGTANSSVRIFAPSGNYFLAATSFSASVTGAYQLTSSGLAGNVNCDEYWVVPGVSIAGTLTATDCDFDGYMADDYLVVLRPGQTLSVRLESAAFDAYLALYNDDLDVVASNDDGAGGTNSLMTYTYTGTGPALFLIDASTFDPGESGAYTLIVTRS